MRRALYVLATCQPLPHEQMDVNGFSPVTVANATAASGLDLHYAKESVKFQLIVRGEFSIIILVVKLLNMIW